MVIWMPAALERLCAPRCGDAKAGSQGGVGWGVGLGLGSMKGSSREMQARVVVLLNTYSRAFLVGGKDGVGGAGKALRYSNIRAAVQGRGVSMASRLFACCVRWTGQQGF